MVVFKVHANQLLEQSEGVRIGYFRTELLEYARAGTLVCISRKLDSGKQSQSNHESCKVSNFSPCCAQLKGMRLDVPF